MSFDGALQLTVDSVKPMVNNHPFCGLSEPLTEARICGNCCEIVAAFPTTSYRKYNLEVWMMCLKCVECSQATFGSIHLNLGICPFIT